jgi:hypothetical protein
MLRSYSLEHPSSRSPFLLLTRAALLAGLAPSLASAQVCFETNPVLSVGSQPHAMHAADLNADGVADLVVADGPSGVTVALSAGASVGATNAYAVGERPYAVKTADLDADGDQDIVTANYFGSSLSVLLNDGAGYFGNASDHRVGGFARSVALADFDGDLDTDAFVVGEGSTGIWILFNDGTGVLSPALSISITALSDVIAADLDGDGDTDAAATRFEGSTVVVFLNQGDGTFAPYSEVSALAAVTVLASADLDGDGDIDLAVGKTQIPALRIMLNNGDGTFQLDLGYNVSTNINDIVAVDLDDDGDEDLALTNPGGFTTLLNQSNAFFVPSNYEAGSSAAGLAVADWNSDGTLDLAVALATANSVFFWLNRGDATFFAPGPVADGVNGRVVGNDLDGDGDVDLVATNVPGGLSILRNGGNGVFAQAEDYAVHTYYEFDLELADLDNDGDTDIAIPDTESLGLSILFNAGNGTFPQINTHPVGLYPYTLTGADYDGDGDHDLAVANNYPNTVKVLRNAGDGTFTESAVYMNDFDEPHDLTSADMDGDGIVDLVVRVDQAFGLGTSLLVFRNEGAGAFVLHSRLDGLGNLGVQGNMFGADFDADGDIDVAASTQTLAGIALFLNSGGGTLAPAAHVQSGAYFPTLNVGDIDQDGDLDLVAADQWRQSVNLILNQGSATFAPPLYLNGALRASDLAIADFDGDRDLDIVAVSHFDETLRMLRNCTSSGSSFCFGDGSQGACPCNNNAPAGSGGGCLNSLGTSAILRATGSARLVNDGLVLESSQLTDGAALYFQGTAPVHSAAFGDGLRCVGGTLTRLAVQPSVGGHSSYPGAGEVRISVRGEITVPGQRFYQTWYRNAATFCTGAVFNMTNAVSIVWSL